MQHPQSKHDSAIAGVQHTLQYSQARLLDALLVHFGLRRDSHLAEKLGMPRPMICKLRKSKIPVGAAVLIRIHEISGLGIRELRTILGDRRRRFRGGYQTYSVEERISVVNQRAIATMQSGHNYQDRPHARAP